MELIRVGNDVRVEDTEEANAVEGIVDDHAVEQHLVLDGRSPADVELSALVTCGHKARKRLQHLHQVRRATQAGDALDVGGLDGLD